MLPLLTQESALEGFRASPRGKLSHACIRCLPAGDSLDPPLMPHSAVQNAGSQSNPMMKHRVWHKVTSPYSYESWPYNHHIAMNLSPTAWATSVSVMLHPLVQVASGSLEHVCSVLWFGGYPGLETSTMHSSPSTTHLAPSPTMTWKWLECSYTISYWSTLSC